jgi:hypothetical protein
MKKSRELRLVLELAVRFKRKRNWDTSFINQLLRLNADDPITAYALKYDGIPAWVGKDGGRMGRFQAMADAAQMALDRGSPLTEDEWWAAILPPNNLWPEG